MIISPYHIIISPQNNRQHLLNPYLHRTSLVAQMVKRLSTIQETWVRSLGREDSWRRKWQPTPVLLPRKSHGRRSLVQATAHGVAKSWTRLSDFTLSAYMKCYGKY